nr:uncharacterized protein LOC129382844 [Dermacentor andersoni]
MYLHKLGWYLRNAVSFSSFFFINVKSFYFVCACHDYRCVHVHKTTFASSYCACAIFTANVGSAARLEATEEYEGVVLTENEPHIIGRAVNESEGHDHGTGVLLKPPGSRTNPTGRKTGHSPQLLPSRSLLCVLGGRTQEYGPMWLDGLCDVALVPFYALLKGGDTFLNDGDKATQQVLDKAAKAVKTTYGIHVPLKYACFATLSRSRSERTSLRAKVMKIGQGRWLELLAYHFACLPMRV